MVAGCNFQKLSSFPVCSGKNDQLYRYGSDRGAICHQIRVELSTEYRIDYFIDIQSFREIEVQNTDFKTGLQISVVYHDYAVKSGIPFAMRIESFEEGEWVSTLEVEEVKVNTGIMPWMFEMPM